MQNLSRIARPLTKLMQKGEKYIWNEECSSVLEKLKLGLTQPNGFKGIILYSDALEKVWDVFSCSMER